MNIYAYQRPLGPIADDEALRQQYIAVYDVKTHQQVVRFCCAYGHRLHKLIGYTFPYSSDIADAYAGIELSDWPPSAFYNRPSSGAFLAYHGTAHGEPACEISRAVGKRLCHHPYQHYASKRRSSSAE